MTGYLGANFGLSGCEARFNRQSLAALLTLPHKIGTQHPQNQIFHLAQSVISLVVLLSWSSNQTLKISECKKELRIENYINPFLRMDVVNTSKLQALI